MSHFLWKINPRKLLNLWRLLDMASCNGIKQQHLWTVYENSAQVFRVGDALLHTTNSTYFYEVKKLENQCWPTRDECLCLMIKKGNLGFHMVYARGWMVLTRGQKGLFFIKALLPHLPTSLLLLFLCQCSPMAVSAAPCLSWGCWEVSYFSLAPPIISPLHNNFKDNNFGQGCAGRRLFIDKD